MNNGGENKIPTSSGGGNMAGNAASKGIQAAQSKEKERKDSNVQRQAGGLKNAKRDSKSGLDSNPSKGLSDSSSSRSSNNTQNSSFSNKNKANANSGINDSKNKGLSGNKSNGNNNSPLNKMRNNGSNGTLSKVLGRNKNGNQGKVVPGITTAGRIVNAINSGKNKAKVKISAMAEEAVGTNDSANEENPKEKLDDNAGEEVTEGVIHISKIVIKIALIIISIIPVLIIVLLAVIICLNPVQKVLIKMFINLSDKDFGETIEEMDNEIPEEDLTYINLSKDFRVYLNGNNSFIDDDEQVNTQFTAKSSENIDLSFLNKYYKLDCKGKECEKQPSYRFYRKLYDIYFLYKYKYNVKINLGLLAATLDFKTENSETTFDNNLQDYDKDAVRESDYNNDNITDLDWEYDYKKIDGYKYLNAKDFRYDMQILAKNMVSKKITYKCNGESSSSSSGSADDSLKAITDNSSKGDGWDSVTKVTYPDGTKRTFRNYKQCVGSYSTKSYWGGNICSSGCGPTAVAIILSGYGYDYNPAKVVNKMHKLNITYTNIDQLDKVLNKLNIKTKKGIISNNSETINAIRNNFKAGRPIMLGLTNHWITYLGENSKGLILSDPGDSYASNDKYGKTLEDLVKNPDARNYILIQSDDKASSSTSSSSKKSKSTKSSYDKDKVVENDDGTKTMYDVETSNYESGLKCNGGTVDTDSISEEYELSMDKYDEFLLEYIEHKYYLSGEEVSKEEKNTTITSAGESSKYKTQEEKIKWLYDGKGVPQSNEENKKYLGVAKVKYIDNATGKKQYRNLTVHKKLVPDIQAIFDEMAATGFKLEWSSGGGSIRTWGTDVGYSGAFYQSAHAYGHAVDINVDSNYCIGSCGQVGSHYLPGKDPLSVTPKIVNIWKSHGFYWGGDWTDPKDYMHFSYFDH